MSAAKRLIHLVRSELPAAALAEGDLVVYASEEPSTWRWGAPDGEPIDAQALLQLLFDADAAVVW